jgi:hypothetical protein
MKRTRSHLSPAIARNRRTLALGVADSIYCTSGGNLPTPRRGFRLAGVGSYLLALAALVGTIHFAMRMLA